MDFGDIARQFAANDQVRLVAFLWGADFVLGVLAGFVTHTFRLSYIADTLRNDGLKVLTWFILFALGVSAHGADIVGPIDFGTFADAAFVAVTAALVGSILNSVADLGVDMPEVVAGSEKQPVVPADEVNRVR